MQCLNCEKEFNPIRASSKFCSPKCRVYYSRVSVTDSVTKEEVSVTNDTLREVSVTEDKSHFKPNWTRVKGLTKENVPSYILASLADNPRLEGAVFSIMDKSFIIKNKKAVLIVGE